MKQRIITALVTIPIAFLLIRWGGLPCALFVAILAFVGWSEYRNMLATEGINVFTVSSGFVGTWCVLCFANISSSYILPVLMVATLAILIEGLLRRHHGNWKQDVAMSLSAVLYVGLLFAHFILLRNLQGKIYPTLGPLTNVSLGEAMLWVVLLGTWASDTFAYFFGCAFGKHKLIPDVSPHKSVEGAVAGFLGCLLVMLLLSTKALGFSLWQSLPLALLVGIFAPLGDLIESILKRSYHVKDSGNFFPGHGGVLDRCDSLLFAIPLAYYYIIIVLM